MPYILENMAQGDIQDVSTIERLCFTMPWPTSAYRRELKTPQTNRYVVSRFVSPQIAAQIKLRPPTEASLTALTHPELSLNGNGHSPAPPEGLSGRSLFASLFPWRRNNPTVGAESQVLMSLPVVGYAGLWLMVDEAHVTTIGVHPDHRGQGAGELLFLGLADIATEMHASRMTLEVRVSNLTAQALYRKYGMEIAGVRKRYYSDNGEDAYIMWSEPITSPQFKNRIEGLRRELAARLQHSFHEVSAPAHPVDRTHLQ